MELFIGLLLSGIAAGAIYAMVGMGFVFTYRSLGTFNFFHGEISMVAAVVAFLAIDRLDTSLVVAIPLGLAAAVAVALIGDRLIFTRMERAPQLSVMLATAALGIFILRGAAEGVFGVTPQRLPAIVDGTVPVGGVGVREQDLLALAVLAVLVGILWAVFRFTQIGRAMRAISQNPLGATVVGINARATRRVALGVAGLVGGIAGVLVAPTALVSADMGAPLLLKAFACALVGGLTSFSGALTVGLLLGALEILTAYYWDADMRDLVAFALMMVVLLVAPQGILGPREVTRV